MGRVSWTRHHHLPPVAASQPLRPPTADDVQRIAGICDPIVRNLRITHCYAQLSTAVAARTGECSNWCTFATWASRQAGATIRGEDMLDTLRRRLRLHSERQHPIRSIWRALLRRGVFQPSSRIGRLVRAVHTPFDALEATSDAVARGNLKVFAEIARAFANWLNMCPPDATIHSAAFTTFLNTLRPGDPPDGQIHLQQAFTAYQRQRIESDPQRRAELVALGNLLIGLHEQMRLQPEIRDSLDTPLSTARDLRERLVLLFPGGTLWRTFVRLVVAPIVTPFARPIRRYAERLSREVITECLMVLSLPDGTALRLGQTFSLPADALLSAPAHPELASLCQRFAVATTTDGSVEDWSDFEQRMRYIAQLFRALHRRADLFSAPFTESQVAAFQSGQLPDGRL
jgi:hypothetical protein